MKRRTTAMNNDDELSKEDEDELPFLTKRWQNLLKRRKGSRRNFSKRYFHKGESSRKIRCFECNKLGRTKTGCTFLKKDFKRNDPKKKAMMATWDGTNSSSSEKEFSQPMSHEMCSSERAAS
ncbi:hypothetical protein GmHk_16G046454 [Glycine max]|nr:hypothetical protein GmHk_16G046454 [Glycine max]